MWLDEVEAQGLHPIQRWHVVIIIPHHCQCGTIISMKAFNSCHDLRSGPLVHSYTDKNSRFITKFGCMVVLTINMTDIIQCAKNPL